MPRRLLPFNLHYSSFGLSGKDLERARAKYYLEGEELELALLKLEQPDHPTEREIAKYNWDRLKVSANYKDLKFERDEAGIRYNNFGFADEIERQLIGLRLQYNRIDAYVADSLIAGIGSVNDNDKRRKQILVDINHGRISEYEADLGLIDTSENLSELEKNISRINLDVKHGKRTRYEADIAIAEIESSNDDELHIAKRKVELAHGKITKQEFDKEEATRNGEPWVHISHAAVNYSSDGSQFEFELDWNELFVAELINSGFRGETQEDIIDEWFRMTAADIFADEMGFGDIPIDAPVEKPTLVADNTARARKTRKPKGIK